MKAVTDFLLGRGQKIGNYPSSIVLFYRMFTALVMLPFGWSKILDFQNLSQDFFGDPIGIGHMPSLLLTILAQLVCPVFLLVGFQTRSAAFILFFNMLVATKYHFFDPMGKLALPLSFMVMYLVQMLMGPGKYSLDSLIFGKDQPIYPYQWAGVALMLVAFILGWFIFGGLFSGPVSCGLLVLTALILAISFKLLK